MIENHEVWLEKIANQKTECSQIAANIELTAREDPQDESLPVLTELLDRGYSKVVWHAENSAHDECRALDGKEWGLKEFIDGTTHDAPVFSRSHPGDRSCYVVISGEGLEDCKCGPWPTWR
jgi:hypothetical protein